KRDWRSDGCSADLAAAESVDVAGDALRHGREADAGQARGLISTERPAPERRDPPDGGRWATELVRPDESVAATIAGLLADVVVVEDLHAARPLCTAEPDQI